MCFADDLLIFSEATLRSIHIIKAVFIEFEELSSLKANPSKSFFFCSSISDRVKQLLLGELKLNAG